MTYFLCQYTLLKICGIFFMSYKGGVFMNDVSLTVRLPDDLDKQLKATSKALGFTKTNMIRLSIHEYLDPSTLDDLKEVVSKYGGDRHRLVLNINQLTYDILEKLSIEHDVSINHLLIYSSAKSLEHYSKLLKKLEQ